MGEHDVIDVGLVLHLELPVAVIAIAKHTGAGFDLAFGAAVAKRIDVILHWAQEFINVGNVRAQADKHKSAIDFHPRQLYEIEFFLIEEAVRIALGVGCPGEAAVIIEDPGVIGAFKPFGITELLETDL